MDDAAFFSRQLASTAEGFIWAVGQVPADRQRVSPPAPDWLGQWDVPRHIFHMLTYERDIALPSMRQWLGETGLDEANIPDEDDLWSKEMAQQIDQLLASYQEVRAEQIKLLPRFTATDWERACDAIWGSVTLH